VHPGATLLPPALAIAQEHGSSGRDLITAIVAGFEVMYRIGRATKHSNERRGSMLPAPLDRSVRPSPPANCCGLTQWR
jgi:2-methylcitrate dehydratase PrpD